MATYKKINNQAVQVSGGNDVPEYFFDTLAEAQAALANIEDGANIYVKEGSVSDVGEKVEELEDAVDEINTDLSNFGDSVILYTGSNIASETNVSITSGYNISDFRYIIVALGIGGNLYTSILPVELFKLYGLGTAYADSNNYKFTCFAKYVDETTIKVLNNNGIYQMNVIGIK